MLIGLGTRDSSCRLSRQTVGEQCRRAVRSASRESLSARRLIAIWAEEDAEIEARLGGTAAMAYRFKCRYCGSQFSLEQQLGDHEKECAKMEGSGPKESTDPGGDSRLCKYCGKVQPNFAAYGKHRWAAHREQVLADLATKRERQKADEKKIDTAIAGKKRDEAAAAPPGKRARSNSAAAEPGPTCPTCGGNLPVTTAQLVSELTEVGMTEGQAFAAARIARRILVSDGSAH